jgi:hypothetical protein
LANEGKRLRCLALTFAAWLASAAALPAAQAQEAGIIQPDTPVAEVLEATRQTVRESVHDLASRIDGWFGPVPFDEGGGKVSDGQVDLELRRGEDNRAHAGIRFKVNVRLPNLEKQAYAFIGQDDPRGVVADQPDDLTRADRLLAQQRGGAEQFFAGIGHVITDNIDLRAGVSGLLKPFAQARMQHRWVLGSQDAVDGRETAFVTLADKIGSTTVLQYEHSFSSALVLRYLTAVTVTQADPHFRWSSILGAYKDFGGQRVATIEGSATGTARYEVPVTDYGVQATWEQPIYHDWVLAQVVAGRFWPRASLSAERTGRWVAGLYLKMRF